MLSLETIIENHSISIRLMKSDIGEIFIEKYTKSPSPIREFDKYKYWEYYFTEARDESNGGKYGTEIIKISRIDGRNVIDEEMCLDLFGIIENILIKSEAATLSEAIKKCEGLFEKQKKVLKEQKLVTYLGELVFIDIVTQIYPKAILWWRRKDNMEVDLYIKENDEYLEIKVNSNFRDEFTIKLNQILNNDPFVAGVSFKQNDNGKNIIYYVDKFKNSDNDFLNEFIDEVSSLINDFPKILDYKINIDNVKVKIFDKEDFPIIDKNMIDDKITCIEYKVDTSSLKFYEIEEFIKNFITKGEN